MKCKPELYWLEMMDFFYSSCIIQVHKVSLCLRLTQSWRQKRYFLGSEIKSLPLFWLLLFSQKERANQFLRIRHWLGKTWKRMSVFQFYIRPHRKYLNFCLLLCSMAYFWAYLPLFYFKIALLIMN